jgi:hypothetical protein
MKSFILPLLKSLSNLPGWRTNRRIVVIESDDWGSIRMPSLKAYQHLQQLGLNIDKGDNQRYNTLDTLASSTDLAHLFETLRRVKDNQGHHPVFTAMSLVANPDFEKIAGNGFTQYEYEPFTTTLEQYGLSDAFTLWQQGADEHLFHADFHGREHLNVKVWMDALRHGDPHTRAAFDQGSWGFRPAGLASINFQAAFDLDRPEDVEVQKEIITDRLDSFEQLHGYRATYMVPPNGPFSDLLEPAAASAGIKYLATAKIHKAPLGNGKHRKGFRYLGKKN